MKPPDDYSGVAELPERSRGRAPGVVEGRGAASAAVTFLPFEAVFNPRWWRHAAGISFERPFYFDPAARVRNDVMMRRVLHQRFGDIGLGEAEPQPRPVAGSLHVAGGFVIPALLGADIRFEPDAAPQPLPAPLSAGQHRAS